MQHFVLNRAEVWPIASVDSSHISHCVIILRKTMNRWYIIKPLLTVSTRRRLNELINSFHVKMNFSTSNRNSVTRTGVWQLLTEMNITAFIEGRLNHLSIDIVQKKNLNDEQGKRGKPPLLPR